MNESPIQAIRSLMERSPGLRSSIRRFSPGDVILHENETNDKIYILLEGEIELIKKEPNHDKIVIDQFQSGAFLGLLSFWSKDPTFTSSQAITRVECLCLQRKAYEALLNTDAEFKELFTHLIISNLVDRYRRVVNLNIEVQKLTQALENERNRLQETVADLHRTRNQLINQEKLATLGQLLAGIAHEMNNPCAALCHSASHLNHEFPLLFEENGPLKNYALEGKLLHLGLNSPYLDANETRQRMSKLSDRFPHLKRSIVRRLSQIPMQALELLENKLKLNSLKPIDEAKVHHTLIFFDIGTFLRSINSSAKRIHRLIVSLKNYGRPNSTSPEHIDIREGIHDTLLLLNNRLKHYTVHLNLSDIPAIDCHPGEINQVWTNILTNACDAMPAKASSEIHISCGLTDNKSAIWVVIEDNGPGIPEEILSRIFAPNFTTKSRGDFFGLGLGLSISKSIIEKHQGKITADNSSLGGASFHIHLPCSNINQ